MTSDAAPIRPIDTTSSWSAPDSPACTCCTASASQGLSVRVFEAGCGVGGTWYWNRYPGARCDVESVRLPVLVLRRSCEQEWTWTERYAPQAEILAYLNHVADRFDLRRDIQFDTRVDRRLLRRDASALDGRRPTAATGSAPRSWSWRPAACRCRACPTSRPRDVRRATSTTPARWPHEGVDFTGKRVGVIGTGSSGIQSIPVIAEQAAQLTVFQRTPNYSVPALNRPLDADERARRSRATTPSSRGYATRDRRRADRPGTGQLGARRRRPRSATAIYEAALARWAASAMYGAFTDLLHRRGGQRDRAPTSSATRSARWSPTPSRRAAVPEGLPVRRQAHLRRHRLLRDVQPRQRDARRPQGATPIERDHARRDLARRRPSTRARRDRVRHRLRRDDRRAAGDRHPRPRRPDAAGEVGRTARAPTSGWPIAGFPNLFTDHRPGQPVGAQQHDRVDRAARGLDRRLHRAAARRRAAADRGRPRRPRTPGSTHVNDVADSTLLPRATPGTWAPTCPASRGSSCPTRRGRRLPAASATRWPPTATTASSCRLTVTTAEATPEIREDDRAPAGTDVARPCHRVGAGEPLLLICGTTQPISSGRRCCRLFRSPRYQLRPPRHRELRPGRRGDQHGLAGRDPAALLGELGLDRAHVLGWSLGSRSPRSSRSNTPSASPPWCSPPPGGEPTPSWPRSSPGCPTHGGPVIVMWRWPRSVSPMSCVR